MADFTLITLAPNTGNQGAPVWTNVLGGADTEVRWFDTDAAGLDVASAAWPAMIRPASVAPVAYTYAYTADAVGLGFIGSTGVPVAFDNDNFLFARWGWDALGTFASAPIFTAYPSIAHGPIMPDDQSLLGGDTTDTGDFSYLKANAYGQDVGNGAPVAAPPAVPDELDGTIGPVSPGAGANWLATYQDLQGDNDYILAPFIPTATSADQWNVIFALFTGPHMTPAVYENVLSLKYTWT